MSYERKMSILIYILRIIYIKYSAMSYNTAVV